MVTPAPICNGRRAAFDLLQVFDAVQGRRLCARSRSCLVTQRPTSVAPAIRVASGLARYQSRQIVTVARVESAGDGLSAPSPDPFPEDISAKVKLAESAVIQSGTGACRQRFGRADDRGVAGAAAQVACELVVMIGAAVQMGGGHRDDKPRRAKAALAAVMGDHRGLNRMQGAIGARDAFDRAHGFAMQLGQEQDAGVQRAAAAVIGDHDRAGAAIAFIAAFFGAAKAAIKPQPIQQVSASAVAPATRNLAFHSAETRYRSSVNLPPSPQVPCVEGRCVPPDAA